MKYQKVAFALAVISFLLLLMVIFSSKQYDVVVWKSPVMMPGVLFPFLFSSWVLALFAIAFNFIHSERALIFQNISLPRKKKWLPLLISLPSLVSFSWFLLRVSSAYKN